MRFPKTPKRYKSQLQYNGDQAQTKPNLSLTVGQSQTGNPIEVNSTTGTNLFKVDKTGTITGVGTGITGLTPSIVGLGNVPNVLPVPSANYYGYLYNKTTWANTSDFTANSTATISASSGTLIVGGGTATRSVTIDVSAVSQTCLPKWVFSTTFTIGTVNSTSYGIGIGIRSTNHYNAFNIMTRVDLSTGVSAGTVWIDVGTSAGGALNQDTVTSTSALAITSGHSVQFTFERNEDIFTATIQDLTAQTLPVSVSYQVSMAYAMAFFMPNTGYFSIYEIQGSQTITALSISSNCIQNPDLCLVGDSKTAGYECGAYSGSFAAQLQNNFRSITLAGGGDGTQEVLNRMTEIIALNPKTVLLCIGRNDIGNITLSPIGTTGTIEFNYNSIVTQLQAAGITVYHLLPLYETAVSQATFSSFISSTYGAANCIADVGVNYSATASNVLAPDNAHPNAFFHSLVYQQIVHFYSLKNPSFVSYKSNYNSLQQQTLTDGSTISTWDVSLGPNAVVTLGGTGRTLPNPVNLVTGATYNLIIKQNGSGSQTITTWGSVYKFPNGVKPVLSTAINAIDIVSFFYDGTNLYGVAQKAFS